MTQKLIHKDYISDTMIPFIYNECLIIQSFIGTHIGLYGYKEGEFYFFNYRDLPQEMDIVYLDSNDEVDSAMAVCEMLAKKLAMAPEVHVNGLTSIQVSEIGRKALIKPFSDLLARYRYNTAALLV